MHLALELANCDPDALPQWAAQAGAPVGLDARGLAELRADVAAVLAAACEQRQPPAAAVARLNRLSAAAPWFARLEDGELAYVAHAAPDVAFRADVASDAIVLAGGPPRPRLRVCRAPRCGRLFLASRAAQTWCSERCGSRARVARFRVA